MSCCLTQCYFALWHLSGDCVVGLLWDVSFSTNIPQYLGICVPSLYFPDAFQSRCWELFPFDVWMAQATLKISMALWDRELGQVYSLQINTEVLIFWKVNLEISQQYFDSPPCHTNRPCRDTGFKLSWSILWRKPAALRIQGQIFPGPVPTSTSVACALVCIDWVGERLHVCAQMWGQVVSKFPRAREWRQGCPSLES